MIKSSSTIATGTLISILLMVVVGFGSTIFYRKLHRGNPVMSQPELRFMQSGFVPVDAIDPAKIRVLEDYHLVTSIYSPLIEYTTKGQLVGAIADKFYWVGNDLVFEIKENLKSSKGDTIDATDVEFSLKRLLVLQSNSHGDLSKLLCQGEKLDSLSSPCPGIVVDNKKIILKFDARRHYLLPMFSNMDFAVIPRKSVDPTSLKIIDHKNTSGPYMIVSEDHQKKEIVVKARTDHWHYSKKIPQVVRIGVVLKDDGTDADGLEKVEALKAGKADVLSNMTFFDRESGFNLAQNDPAVLLHKTQNIAVSVMIFTSLGKEDFSAQERLRIGIALRSKAAAYLAGNKHGRSPTFEYFSRSAAGHLDSDQIASFEKIIESMKNDPTPPSKKAKIGVHKQSLQAAKKMYGEENEYFELVAVDKPWWASKDSSDPNMPHAQITTTDVGFNEDFNLLAYTESFGGFPYSNEENKIWLDRYMREENEVTRLKMMKDLHFDILKSANLVPISSLSYLALSRKPWELHFSDLFAGSPLWEIEYTE